MARAYQLFEAFRQLERAAATTFVTITGHAEGAGSKAALEARFDLHVPKAAGEAGSSNCTCRRRNTIFQA